MVVEDILGLDDRPHRSSEQLAEVGLLAGGIGGCHRQKVIVAESPTRPLRALTTTSIGV